jgi:proteasome lid subunit RPN8/RPN11
MARTNPTIRRVLVTETALVALADAANRSYPFETGGILVGVTEAGCPWITEVIEVHSTDRGTRHYRLPAGATQPAVRAARRRDSRLGYLGDWHSHPGDAGASGIDLATLAVMTARRRNPPGPTLLVVRRTPSGAVVEATQFVRASPKTCQVVPTGNLGLRDPNAEIKRR